MTVPVLASTSVTLNASGQTSAVVLNAVDLSDCSLAFVMVYWNLGSSSGTFSIDASSTSGWTILQQAVGGSGLNPVALVYKVNPTNNETLVIDPSATATIIAALFKVTGANHIAAAQSTVLKDPPALDIGSVQDVLWIEYGGTSSAHFNSASTGYSNFTNYGFTGSPGIASATKDGAASQTEDPDLMTASASINRYNMWTIGTWFAAVAVNGNASGDVATVNASAPAAGGTGNAGAAGVLGTATLAAPVSTESGDANIIAPIVIVSAAAPAAAGAADGNSSAPIGTLTLAAPLAQGSASVAGAGDLGTVSLAVVSGPGTGAAAVSGQVATLLVAAPIDAASGDAAISGALGTLALSASNALVAADAAATGAGPQSQLLSPNVIISGEALETAQLPAAVSLSVPAGAGAGAAQALAGGFLASLTVPSALVRIILPAPPARRLAVAAESRVRPIEAEIRIVRAAP